jgi:aspartate/methionine/tyrosine aminotransferase
MRSEYIKRINFIVPRLNEIDGIRCPIPEGAFYAFPEIPPIKVPPIQFIMNMIKKVQLLAVPGEIYGSNGGGHLRFSLVKPVEVLEEAANRFEKYITDKNNL